MSLTPTSPLSATLAAAVAQVRRELGDPVAAIAVLTPSHTNGTLAWQQLALAGDVIRVEMLTPERLVATLARPGLVAAGLSPEPASWRSATVRSLLGSLDPSAVPLAARLGQAGWSSALAGAVDTLEAAGISGAALDALTIPGHDDRLALLARLLRGVAERRAQDRLASLSDRCDAAASRVEDTRWSGSVILGDRLLPPRVHNVLAAWLAARPHIEVRLAPWGALAAAPHGLRAATSGRVLDVPPATRLAATLGGAPSPAQEGEVVFARTPDDVRELAEATRSVLDAVHAGVPLEQIAVVLPDAEPVAVLRGHLDAAGVPTTWLTGPPLSTSPAGRFLLHLLDAATGDDTVPAWYALLRQPGLRLRGALGDGATRGRGRWRRILSRCGAVRDTDAIARAVDAWGERLDDPPFDPSDDRLAAQSLSAALRAIGHELLPLASAATLGEHAQRWAALVIRWWRPSPDRAQLLSVLAGWGSAGLGPRLLPAAAIAELRDALARSPVLHGSLSDPAVRVLTPMGLLGGAFAHVVVTGLTEGRLPRHPGEDPLLPDALVESLRERLGAPLLTSRDVAGFEPRRFAAVVGACTGRLWLSAPATELLAERPLLPSVFLLEAAGAVLGRRARYADLAKLQVRFGTRARPWPSDPDRATDVFEHRIASVAHDRSSGLRLLAAAPASRRLLGLHRALDRGGPSPWTGLVPPGTVPIPGADGTPLHPRALARLATDPGDFFVQEVLTVRRIDPLYATSDPLRKSLRQRQLLAAIEAALDVPGDRLTAVLAAWDASVATWSEHRVDVDGATLAMARRLAALDVERLIEAGVLPPHDRVWRARGGTPMARGRRAAHDRGPSQRAPPRPAEVEADAPGRP
ncbi:MAG: hypothetical protein ACI8PZ_003532 [Myxococcota bacterium]|jgi:hypothetical protein